MSRERTLLFSCLVFLAAFGLYVCTLAPSVEIHDAGEISAAAWTWGVMHPAGSPLHLILAGPFMRALPMGAAAFRSNLFSAFCAAAACAVLFAFLRRLGAPRPPAAAAALSLAACAAFWFPAVLTEVYALNTLLLFIALWTFRLWEEEPSMRRALVFALCWGLLLANHMGLSPLTPLIWLAMAWRMGKRGEGSLPARLRLGTKAFALMSLVFLAAFSLYLYEPLRSASGAQLDWGRTGESLQNFFDHVTARNVHERQFSLSAERYMSRAGQFAGIAARQFTPLGVALALAGLCWLAAGSPWLSALALAVLATDGFFVVFLDSAPIESEHYAVPAAAVLALFFGSATAAGRRFLPRTEPYLRPWEFLLLGLPVLLVSLNWHSMNRRENFVVYDNVVEMLSIVEPNGVLLAKDDNHVFPLAYMRAVEGRRPDVLAVDRSGNLLHRLYEEPLFRYGSESSRERMTVHKRMEEDLFHRSLGEGRAVYLTDKQPLYRMDPAFRMLAWGPLARVLPGDADPPPLALAEFALRGEARTEHDWILGAVLMMRAIHWGEHYWRLGHTEEAVRRFRAASAFDARYPELHFNLGQIHMRNGQYVSATKEFETVLSIRPDYGFAWLQKGFAEGVMEDYGAAEKSLLRARELLPEMAEVHEFLANVYERTGRKDKMAESLRACLRFSPFDHEQRQRYARLLIERGAWQEAAQTLEAARDLPDVPMELLAMLAEVYEGLGKPREALALWEEIGARGRYQWLEISQKQAARIRKQWGAAL